VQKLKIRTPDLLVEPRGFEPLTSAVRLPGSYIFPGLLKRALDLQVAIIYKLFAKP
jgi:hypothetical protein